MQAGPKALGKVVGGIPHTVGKLSIRATTILETLAQSEVFTKSYGPPKS
jgi:hypothetical protein